MTMVLHRRDVLTVMAASVAMGGCITTTRSPKGRVDLRDVLAVAALTKR